MTAAISDLDIPAVVSRRSGRQLLHQLIHRPIAAISAAVLLLFILIAILCPLISPHDPNATDFSNLFGGVSGSHPLGTDDLGRDVLSRLFYGARVSLIVGAATTALAFVVAVPLGLVAGYYRGWLDLVIARSVDLMLAFPYLILAVGMAVILGPSLGTVVLALAVAQLPWLIRITRGEVLALREREYVAAAVLDGASDTTILFRYILPNLASPLLVQATLLVPFGIVGEALLSFLGLGVRPPTATWGVMLSRGQSFVHQDPALAVVPGIAILVVTFAFNLVGDALRDVLDPRSTR